MNQRKATIQVVTFVIALIGLVAPVIWAQNTVETIGGGGPNNLPALKSSMGLPTSVTLDNLGNVYIADLYSARIFKVDSADNVTVVAGNGARGFNSALGDGIPATSAYSAYPLSVALDSFGNIFILDRSLCKVRAVSAQTGNISTVVGSTGNCRYSGDGGPATSATLDLPNSIAVDRFGNMFIADTCVVRKVSAQTGNISAVAGIPPDASGVWNCGYSGDGGLATSATIGLSYGVALDGSGNLFIADNTKCVVREVSASTGIISTVAGSGACGYSGDGGPATSAKLAFSNGLSDGVSNGMAVDASGNLFITDTANCVVREVSAITSIISTVAGTGTCGYSGDGGLASSAKLNYPAGVAVDRTGNLFIADAYNSVIRYVSAASGNISTFAGVAVPDPNHSGQMIGLHAYSGDGYPAPDASIGFLNAAPWSAGMATDHSGNIFIADTSNNAIRRIDASTGIITTVAGTGLAGFSGDGGPASSAELFEPRDVALDAADNIFIMDSGNCVLRKVSASTGFISTVAGKAPEVSGSGYRYYCNYSGDGGPATDALLYPFDLLVPAGGVAVDSSGNIFIADTGNEIIRKVSASTGIITTVAGIPLSIVIGTGDGGPATSATLSEPYGVTVDNSGNLYIADTRDYAIREVVADSGNIYTVAGNIALGSGFSGDGGPASSAQLRAVYSTFLDPAGNLFIPDPDNCVIRKVSGSTGIISTVAGSGNPTGGYYCGYSGDGGPALDAIFDSPSVAGAGPAGNLVVLDNARVRSVANLMDAPAAAVLSFPSVLQFPTSPLSTSARLTVALTNRGSLPAGISNVVISGTNASDFSETDDCVTHSLDGGGGSCSVNVKFLPSAIGMKSALLTMTGTAGTQAVNLSGAGVDFAVAAASGGSLSATVTQGQTATYHLQLNSIGGMSSSDELSISIACTGAPSLASCSSSPQSAILQGSTPIALTVSVSTTAPSVAMASHGSNPRSRPPVGMFSLLSMLLAFCPIAALRNTRHGRYRRLVWLASALILTSVLLAVGCGGGGSSSTQPPLPPVGGTPAGTYTLTLTATTGGDSHTAQLTLVVNGTH